MDLRRATLNVDGHGDQTTIEAFRVGVKAYASYGAPLYAALCGHCADDPEIIALASRGVRRSRPVHLFASVHYLLLRDPSDPLASFFSTLTENPALPDQAFPEFARFCRQHRDELQHLLETRTVQTTYVERCRALMPPLALAADLVGEPLNLIEIGCSAGVLLTFDKYAYEIEGGGHVGPENAPITLPLRITGNAPLRIPTIGSRTGIDLRTIDVRAEDERRWILALSFPELRAEQARLGIALDVIAATDIRTMEGNALDLLPLALAKTSDPVCIFHSACVFYWDKDARNALESLFLAASSNRDIIRVSIEPSENFDRRYADAAGAEGSGKRLFGEVNVDRYCNGKANKRLVARTNPDYGILEWVG